MGCGMNIVKFTLFVFNLICAVSLVSFTSIKLLGVKNDSVINKTKNAPLWALGAVERMCCESPISHMIVDFIFHLLSITMKNAGTVMRCNTNDDRLIAIAPRNAYQFVDNRHSKQFKIAWEWDGKNKKRKEWKWQMSIDFESGSKTLL